MLCHVSVHSGAFCLRYRARDPISVAFSDRVALFSVFNHLFELLDQVLLPIAVAPFYAQKTFWKRSLRIVWTIFMSETYVSHIKPWSKKLPLAALAVINAGGLHCLVDLVAFAEKLNHNSFDGCSATKAFWRLVANMTLLSTGQS